MKLLQGFIEKLTLVNKWALVLVACSKALDVLNEELKKIDIPENTKTNEDNLN